MERKLLQAIVALAGFASVLLLWLRQRHVAAQRSAVT